MYKLVYNFPMKQFLIDAKSLVYKHWKELAVNQDTVFLEPDIEKYSILQENNILYNVVAYDDDVIIGYSVLLIQPHLHYMSTTYASVNIIYVDEKYRNKTIGARLLLETETLAKEKGANVILHHAKPHVPMIIKPLEKLGYNLYEHVYGKYMGD